ncbi:squalene/phytoene synthase family protein [Polymorphobacter sp.]|uniref:squalene/phytoene synthase family protein n=1 Tax=Polymorphobacter sp. TaxID=1909290 RepID=UPI003F6F46BF
MHLPSGTGLIPVSDTVRVRDRERWLASLYAPAPVRPALLALFALDLTLAEIPASVSEPMVGAIRLAWWREALEALDKGRAPDEPHLEAAAQWLLPAGLSGADLAGLEERWAQRLDGNLDPAAEHAAEAAGGALLFGLAGRLLGGDIGTAEALGRCWAVGGALPDRVPAALRPLLALAALGVRDVADAEAGRPRAVRASAGRQLRILWAVATGR